MGILKITATKNLNISNALKNTQPKMVKKTISTAPKSIHCRREHQANYSSVARSLKFFLFTNYRGCATLKAVQSLRNTTTNQKDTVTKVVR